MRLSFVLGASLCLVSKAAFADGIVIQGSATVDATQQATPPPPPPGPVYVQPQPGYAPAAPVYGYGRPRLRRRTYEYNGGPIPPGAVIEERARGGLIAGGAVLFGVPYLFSVFGALICDAIRSGTSSSSCNSNADWFYVPVLGPFVASAAIPRLDGPAVGFFVLDGLLQAGGVAMFIAGIVATRRVVVMPEEVGQRHGAPRERVAQWTLLPGAPGAPLGMSFAVANF